MSEFARSGSDVTGRPPGSRCRRRQAQRSAFLNWRGICAFATAIVLAGCGTAPRPAGGGFYQDDGPPAQVPADIMATPDAVPRIEPFHPYANRPYVALGRSYTPATDDRPIVQRGLASWYGRQFHGNRTSTGEIYDMFAMTAAHPTMPLPSYARVTHLRNGSSIVVRVNDRGPFKDGRVIDLSYAAAMRLGLASAGTGEVEVQRITHREIAAATPPAAAVAASAPAAAPVVGADAGGAPTTQRPQWSVQLGVFTVPDNAKALLARLQAMLSTPEAQALAEADRAPRIERDGELHRVVLGALPDRESALALAARVGVLLGRDVPLYVLSR